jgi:signal transduction histidine kinase
MLHSRLVISALDDRRRIERALHDGVQQDLIAISVRLQLLRDLVSTGAAETEALASLDEVQQDARSALDRVRTLASEIYPAILDALGLPDALRQAAAASEVTTRVEAAELRRYPAEIEAAVLFLWRTVVDALEPGTDALIRARQEGETLRVEIAAGRRVDLAGVRDLVEGVGGVLTVESRGAGDRIDAAFPTAS